MDWRYVALCGITRSVCLFHLYTINHATTRTPDPLDFDRKCDGSLPLEELLKPDPVLRKLLEDIDRTKVRVWGLTNAYYTVRFSPDIIYVLT